MCGCGRKSGGPAPVWTVKMPDGGVKVYSSDIAAKAKVQTTPGAILVPPPGASV